MFYIEYKILEKLKIEHLFSFKHIKQLKIEVEKLPKIYVILSENAQILQDFQRIGAWTGLQCTLVLSTLDISGIFFEQVNKNIDLIKKGFFPNFTTSTFFQQKYLYEIIDKLNSENPEISIKSKLFNDKINDHLKVVTAIRTSFKFSDYKKHRFILSNEKCIFSPHIGGNDISINKQFNVILNRIIYQSDFMNYKILLQNMTEYATINTDVVVIDNLNNLDGFLLRDKMVDLLKNFIKTDKIKKLNDHYGYNLVFPISQYVSLKLLLDFEAHKQYLEKNNIDLPIIVKFQSDNREVCHQMLLIISENGLRNLSEFVKKFDTENTYCVVQKFANHGGQVIKSYRFCNGSKTYYRPSIPDMIPEYEKTFEEFERGYFNFRTEDLMTKKVLELWKKFKNEEFIESLVDEKYLEEVSAVFEDFVEKTLFGLDFLYDYTNKTYLIIDCNNFPGYKELEKVFWKYLTEHILFYNKQKKIIK